MVDREIRLRGSRLKRAEQIVITVPIWLGAILAVLGVIFWISDTASKAKKRAARRAAKARLDADLRAPATAQQLPYGFSQRPAGPGEAGTPGQ
jgi:hypothetical protein